MPPESRKLTQQQRSQSETILVTIKEAYETLRVSRATLYNMLSDGTFSKVKVRNRTMLHRSEIHAFIGRNTVGPLQEAA